MQFFEALEKREFFSLVSGTSFIGPVQNPPGSGIPRAALAAGTPSIASSNPDPNETNVARDEGIVMFLNLPNGGVDETTLKQSNVILTKTSTGTVIATNRPQTSGGGDTIVLQPKLPLDANTQYTVTVTSAVKDITGVAFTPHTFKFTTGTKISLGDPNIQFEKVSLNLTSRPYSVVTMGPDNRLYAGTLTGYIYRYDVNTDGTLKNETRIDTIRNNNGGGRFVIGLAFDPRSTASNPILWVSHGAMAYQAAPNHSGSISKLTGANLGNYQDMVNHLPRSYKDHVTDQIVFSPDGKNIFFTQPSQSAMGAPDTTWGNRAERILSATVLRLEIAKIESYVSTNSAALDATNYNPYGSNKPLRIYATGVRNAYDLLFHSNGHLYAPANGSALGGNTPATPGDLSAVPNQYRMDFATRGNYTGPTAPALTTVPETQDDYLFDIVEGKYYGHPNPLRGEYVLNGGNPTSGKDPFEVQAYPIGQQPDRNFVGAAYNFGESYSPNGVLEYKSGKFGGRLKGYMLVCRYSNGDDILAIKVNDDGSITSTKVIRGIQGFTGFENPLDITENTANGNLYVAELVDERSAGKITLLKPISSEPEVPEVSINRSRLSMYAVPGTTASKVLTISNSGTANLVLDGDSFRFTGTGRKSFRLLYPITSDITIAPGKSYSIRIQYAPAAGDFERKIANFVFATNDADESLISVQLRGNPVTA